MLNRGLKEGSLGGPAHVKLEKNAESRLLLAHEPGSAKQAQETFEWRPSRATQREAVPPLFS